MNFEKAQIQVFAAVAVLVALALYLLTGWKSFEIFNFIVFLPSAATNLQRS